MVAGIFFCPEPTKNSCFGSDRRKCFMPLENDNKLIVFAWLAAYMEFDFFLFGNRTIGI